MGCHFEVLPLYNIIGPISKLESAQPTGKLKLVILVNVQHVAPAGRLSQQKRIYLFIYM